MSKGASVCRVKAASPVRAMAETCIVLCPAFLTVTALVAAAVRNTSPKAHSDDSTELTGRSDAPVMLASKRTNDVGESGSLLEITRLLTVGPAFIPSVAWTVAVSVTLSPGTIRPVAGSTLCTK